MRQVLAVFLAFAAASLYALSTALQALEARQVPSSSALRVSLLGALVRRRLWIVGGVAALAAWPVQLGALALGSIGLVQPALGFGLVVLLALGAVVLHEHVGRREVGGVAGIAVAVAVLAWSAPSETGAYTAWGTWVVGAGVVAVAPLPVVLRLTNRVGGLATSLGAGVGWAVVALATSLVDESLADRRWAWAVGWGAAVGIASWGALLAEMTALQAWPATRAIPIAFGLEMLLPPALSPLLTRAEVPHPAAFGAGLAVACAAAVLLGGSRAVARAALQPLTEP
jgi:drug/metabolite transporter (DMT)-like permease